MTTSVSKKASTPVTRKPQADLATRARRAISPRTATRELGAETLRDNLRGPLVFPKQRFGVRPWTAYCAWRCSDASWMPAVLHAPRGTSVCRQRCRDPGRPAGTISHRVAHACAYDLGALSAFVDFLAERFGGEPEWDEGRLVARQPVLARK